MTVVRHVNPVTMWRGVERARIGLKPVGRDHRWPRLRLRTYCPYMSPHFFFRSSTPAGTRTGRHTSCSSERS